MKLSVQKDIQSIKRLILEQFSEYNIVHQGQISEEVVFLVIEKYFIRNSSRASLSIVMYQEDDFETILEAVGSGGGTGWLFKFDWGAKESFEHKIISILEDHQIHFKEISTD
ncbi:hypothetical protein BK010_03650 [Tenericutes bacterium MO-XQ]|nr:hypothetical protein BK010_03650 [Tenericutes bacterium MO-XQ]